MSLLPAHLRCSPHWRSVLRRDGYARFERLVPLPLIHAARKIIDRDVEEHYDPSRQAEYEHQSYCPGIRKHEAISRLLTNQAVAALVDEALGWDQLGYDCGQIAIRKAHNGNHPHVPEPHIDGIPTPLNGVTGSSLATFTALVGVFLSDVTQEFAGNLVVWPGSHEVLERYFRERGSAAMTEGMPRVPLGSPVQLMAAPGDLLLCHYQLAHAAAVNLSPNDRYAVYFRLWFKNIAPRRWELLTKIWTDWRI